MKVVIFCGGFGTRIWPASRKSYPKQFYPLIKGRSFFEITVSRFKKKFSPEDILISTEAPYVKFIKKQAPEILAENIILEPERRDTLGAIGLVAAVVEKRFPGEVMFFSWSDHLISKEDKFLGAVVAAGKFTQKTGKPVSINEVPTFPSVHNGWLEIGKEVAKEDGHVLYEIKRHTEKPDKATADKFFKNKNYLIHTGYGAWRSDEMLNFYQEYAPAVYTRLVKISEAWGSESQEKVLKDEYKKIEKQSVEFGLFEKLPHDLRLTISIESGWEDAGTWQLFYKALIEKGEKNVIEGGADTQFIDSEGNLVLGKKDKIISVIGAGNLAIIDTDDALLVCDINQTEKVKKLYKKLEKEKPKYIK